MCDAITADKMFMFNKTADWCRGTTGATEGEKKQRGFPLPLAFNKPVRLKNVNCGSEYLFLCVLMDPVEIVITTTNGHFDVI